MKSYGVTVQMKPLKQYFHIVLFVILNISILKKLNLKIMSNIFYFCYFWELKGYIPVHDQVTSTNA